MTTRIAIAMTCLTATLITAEARADRRIFGFTYPYQTLPEGTSEFEHYLDAGLNGWDNPDTTARERDWTQVDWQHQIEFEYGITDHLDFGFYNVFRQEPFGALRYDGVQLRSRYRFAEQGELALDPAVYVEVGYSGDEFKVEEMLILSKRIGHFELSFNAKFEQEYTLVDEEWDFDFVPLLGVGYHFDNHVALAVEYVGTLKVEQGEVEYFVSYLGLALSVAGGPFYWTLAVQPQLGARTTLAAVQVRSLFGLVF
jgi:hypothetical protein